jgi:hypothetical protein
MKNEDGTPVNAEVPNKKALLFKCGELIPKLASRAQRLAQQQQQIQAESGEGSPAPKTGKTGTGKSKKKKGRR